VYVSMERERERVVVKERTSLPPNTTPYMFVAYSFEKIVSN